MIKKILSVYSANKRVVLTVVNKDNAIDKVTLPLENFENGILMSSYEEFLEALSFSVEDSNNNLKEIKNNDKEIIEVSFTSNRPDVDIITTNTKTKEATKKLSKEVKEQIKVQGTFYPIEAFEEILDMSTEDIIITLQMMVKDLIHYEEKLFTYKLKELGLEVAKTNNTKRYYIKKGAVQYLKDNYYNYLDIMEKYEGRIVYFIEKHDDELTTVLATISSKPDKNNKNKEEIKGYEFTYPSSYLIPVKEIK